MDGKFFPAQFRSTVVGVVMVVVVSVMPSRARAQSVSVDPTNMPRIGNVDERFVSYNIEMAEVTGGNFWKPYHNSSAAAEATPPAQSASTPAGMSPNMYQYRPPIDLANPQLRKLASALGPAYVRVSGTWANSVYFANLDSPPTTAPAGFSGVLTRKEWKGVIDFVQAVNGKLATSFATSVGTRDPEGVWTTKEAGDWLAYTKSVGGQIAAAEFMNEPTYAVMGGAPKGYNAADYARDIAVFGPWLKKNSPGTIFLGPGSVGEGPFAIAMGGMLHSEDLLKATGPVDDGPWAEEDCAGGILLQPRPDTRDIASVISCVVAFRCAAHDSISGLVHELGCRDLPSDGFRVSKTESPPLSWSTHLRGRECRRS